MSSWVAVEEHRFFLRFRFGDRKEILRDCLEEFERPFSIDVISGHYILRDRFGPSEHLKKNTGRALKATYTNNMPTIHQCMLYQTHIVSQLAKTKQ